MNSLLAIRSSACIELQAEGDNPKTYMVVPSFWFEGNSLITFTIPNLAVSTIAVVER